MRGAHAPYPFTRAGRLCVLLALAKLVLLLPILTRYGWDRDELYFLAAGRHLSLGYVDFPPLTAVAARLVDGTIGPSLFSLRLLSSLLAMVAAVAAGAIARELGASDRLQVLACAAWILTPYALGGAVLFHPTFLDLAATAMAMLAATRLVARERPAPVAAPRPLGRLGLGLLHDRRPARWRSRAGCAFWRRDLLLRRSGLRRADRARLLMPNVIWEITHDWISLDFASTQHAKTASDSPPLAYIAQQLAFLGVGAVLVVLGSRLAVAAAAAPAAGVDLRAPSVVFALEQGRSYYALPAMLPALVAGCIALAERHPRRSALAALALVQVAVLALVAAARRPGAADVAARLHGHVGSLLLEGRDRLARADGADGRGLALADACAAGRRPRSWPATTGWRERSRSTGPAAGLPARRSRDISPSSTGIRARMPERAVLLVGFDRDGRAARCSHATVLAVADNRWHVDNEERGRPIVWCRLRRSLGQEWQRSFATARL